MSLRDIEAMAETYGGVVIESSRGRTTLRLGGDQE